MAKTVLVTGVSRYLGGLVARRLAADTSIDAVIGVDVIPPPHDLGRTDFVRADIRNPMIGKVMAEAGVDTVVHMNVIATPTFVGGRTPQKEINVIGTMQLLAACQKSPTVQRLVVKSSAAVYGSTPRDPAMFSEDMSAKRLPSSGFGKDSIEVEGYVRGFSRRRPDVEVTILRLADVVGPGIRTAFTDYFALPVVPVPVGFNARMQFLHEDDATRAMVLATTGASSGLVNVAADGMLTVSQAAALAGRVTVGVPLAKTTMGTVLRRAGLADFSLDQIDFLTYGRGLDTTRMREVMHFEPAFTTRQAFEDYAAHLGPAIPGSDKVLGALGSAASGAGRLVGRLRSVVG